LTILYCSTDRLCRRGAPVKNLAHSASLQSPDKIAPSKSGIKQLGSGLSPFLITKTIALTIRRSSALSVRPRLGLGSLGSVASIAIKASGVMEIVTVLSNICRRI